MEMKELARQNFDEAAAIVKKLHRKQNCFTPNSSQRRQETKFISNRRTYSVQALIKFVVLTTQSASFLRKTNRKDL